MTNRTLPLLAALAMLCVASTALAQETTYFYTGSNFDSVTPPYTTSDRITGSFTVAAPLPPGATTDLSSGLVALSFSDGQATRRLGDTTICAFSVTTNSIGTIIDWALWIRETDPGIAGFQHSLESYAGSLEQSGFSAQAGTTGCGPIGLDPIGTASNGPPQFAFRLPVTSIPLGSPLGLGIMALLLGLCALPMLKRRRVRVS